MSFKMSDLGKRDIHNCLSSDSETGNFSDEGEVNEIQGFLEDLKPQQYEPGKINDSRFSQSSVEESDRHNEPSELTEDNRAGTEGFVNLVKTSLLMLTRVTDI